MNATQYNRINELLSEYSLIHAAFEQAEGEIKVVQLAAAKDLLPKHAELKIKMSDLEDKLRRLADDFYSELFPTDKRSHATPFGGLKYHKSSSLEYDDEEKVLLKIKVLCQQECARESEGHPPRFTEELLIRTHEEPNRDTLAALDDATLALFGITRKKKDNFTIVPFAMKTDKPKGRSGSDKNAKEVKEAA